MILKTHRHELKYIINKSDYVVLKKRLDMLFHKDEHSTNNGYIVTSLYYDDIANTNLYQKIDGDSYRYKYRIRYYNDSHSLFKLEKKEKIESVTNKESCILTKDEVQKIIANDIEFLFAKEGSLCREFYLGIKNNLLKPKVIVRYNRTAYIHKVGNTRITFDSHIKSSLNVRDLFLQPVVYTPTLDQQVVMEIKFSGEYPNMLKSVIQLGNNVQSSMSKYVYSRKFNYYI